MSFISQAIFLAEEDIAQQVAESIAQASTETAKRVVALGEAINRGLAGVGPKLLAAHTEIARKAQEATVGAYDAAIAVRNTPPYRITARNPRNIRIAGGVLRSALTSETFALATEDGILFANTTDLNARAVQWARLNFGAGAAGGTGIRPHTYEITMSDLVVAAVGIEGDVRRAFRIPKGFWIEREFYPVGEVPRGALRGRSTRPNPARTTAGIAAQGWLDAGMAVIAEEIGPAYLRIYRELYEEAKATGGQIVGASVPTSIPSGRVGTGSAALE